MQVVKVAEINHLGSTSFVVLHQGLIIKPIRSEVIFLICLYFATGLLNDMNEVKVLDMGDLDGSQNVRVILRFSADAKYGFASDVVTYGITNSAN
jgi:hypothetical protein